MPTNRTPNYQLSQWEAGDKVQRTDFNEDNRKIDAAIKAEADAQAAANCLHRLIDYTVTANAASVTVSLPGGTSPEQYAALIVCAQLGTNDGSTYSGMQINNVGTSTEYQLSPLASGTSLSIPCIPIGEGYTNFAALYSQVDGNHLMGKTAISNQEYNIYSQYVNYKSIRTFTFLPIDPMTRTPTTGQIRAGSRIRVYGLK